MLFGRTQSQASSLCSAPAACRWPGPGPGMLCGVIPAQKRASGCQRAMETGRVRVLLLLGTTHKRIADLVSVRPRSLCSSPTGCAKHQSCEKVVLLACLPAGTRERLETARHFAQTWSCRVFCAVGGAFPAGCTKPLGEKGLWWAGAAGVLQPGVLEHRIEAL